MTELPTLAVFDFDGTLIEGDSLWPFLIATAGMPKTLWAFASAFVQLALTPSVPDARTFVKIHVIQKILKGRTAESLAPVVTALPSWRRWKEHVRQRLLTHQAQGHHILIASGGLDLYLPTLLADLPHHALICTQTEQRDGILTGRLQNGNCVRKRKAELVAAYIAQHGPFGESWGYGNAPHDLPMLELVKHRLVF